MVGLVDMCDCQSEEENEIIARQQSASFHFFARTYISHTAQGYFETIKTFWINERREVM